MWHVKVSAEESLFLKVSIHAIPNPYVRNVTKL